MATLRYSASLVYFFFFHCHFYSLLFSFSSFVFFFFFLSLSLLLNVIQLLFSCILFFLSFTVTPTLCYSASPSLPFFVFFHCHYYSSFVIQLLLLLYSFSFTLTRFSNLAPLFFPSGYQQAWALMKSKLAALMYIEGAMTSHKVM